MWISKLVLLVPILLTAPLGTTAQSEGDVRLADGPTTNFGRLEIYWQGKWSTFCGLSTGGAQAACRQLGFLDFILYMPLDKEPNIPPASSDTPIAIDYTECERSFSNGLLHVLRCGYSTDVASDCYHSNDMVLKCQSTSLWAHPYDTQVRLSNNSSGVTSSGTLEIFIGEKWGDVCSNGFSKTSADSACRQMGYTGASEYTTTSQGSTDIVWLDNVSCKSSTQSCDCLSGCFGDTPTTPISCPGGKFVQLTCTYDVKIQDKAPSGSRNICENKQTSCTGPPTPPGGGGTSKKLGVGDLVGVVVGVFVLVAAAVLVLGLVCWLVARWRRHKYTSIIN